MGQKVNPHGLRVGVIKDWDSRWYAREDKVGDLVVEDYNIRKYLKNKLYAAGVPLSAIIARTEVMDAVPAGTIGGTYCGNPLACAASLKTIEIMERDHLAERSCEIGKKVTERYLEMKKKYPVIGDVRGLGGMIGIEFVKDQETKEPDAAFTSDLIQTCAKKGLLVEGAGTYNNVIRFLAPLVMTDEQLAAGLDIFEASIKECLKH